MAKTPPCWSTLYLHTIVIQTRLHKPYNMILTSSLAVNQKPRSGFLTSRKAKTKFYLWRGKRVT